MRSAIRLAAAATIGILTLAACSATTPASPPATTSRPAGTSPAAAAPNAVSIKDFAFTPATLTVSRGTTVTFTNADAITHTASSGTGGTKDGKFDKEVRAGAQATITFDTAGTFDYFCEIHPSMRAKVTVQP